MLRFTGKSIDKDDCFYCFRTQLNEDGLFISTETNRAYCKHHLPKHHQQYPNDEFYLNLQKIPKPQKSEEREPKMIKLEIKQQAESELYDMNYDLYQYEVQGNGEGKLTKFDKEAIDEETEEAAQKIINSTSTNRSDELKSWQLDIQPCEHTIDFQQTPITGIDLTKCSECDLKENLWICLTCGKLGCGRAQFGGVAGNTHALQHYETAGHPIAVKLGSLSREVTDVYCYQCNDEITFPNDLTGKLKTFGIDIDNFTKTEKSLVELQIEQNLKWEFNLENEKGEKLPSLAGPGLTGLKNLGNSCYIASVAQTLFALPEYQREFNVDLDLESDSLDFQLKKLANGLASGEFSKRNEEGYQIGIAPTSFKRHIGVDHKEFSSMRQQDAFEFWNYLLEKVDNIDPRLNDIFKFVTVEKLKFPNSKEVNVKDQITENLTLPIVIEVETQEDGVKKYKRQDFIDGLITYLTPEEIEFESKHGKTASKSLFFKTYPKYLITSIQRIQLENWIPIKTDVPLTIPESFDLEDYQPGEIVEDDEVVLNEDEDEDSEEFKPNQGAFDQLLQMGFPEIRAKRALFETGNNPDPEVAMNWLFQHMEDSDIDSPIDFMKRKNASDGNLVDESNIQSLQDMGFSSQLAKKALILNNQDPSAAIEWLFSNPGDDGIIPEQPMTAPSKSNKVTQLEANSAHSSSYSLKAVICHKGTQVTSGHYVAYVKKGDKWVLFNDEKVIDVTGDTKSWEEIERNGYLFVWESV